MNKTVTDITPNLQKDLRKLRVAAYARVSCDKDVMLHSLDAQVHYYRNLICGNPGWEFAGIYADEAKTGTKESREQFQQLLADCRAGNIDMVITKSVSRFARNTVTLLRTVRELKELGINVFFEEQNIKTLDADGEVMLTLLASFAQAESLSVSDNCKWRIRKGFEEGRASTCTMLGYRLVNGEITMVPDEAVIVKKIFDLYSDGCGQQKICNILNEEGIRTRRGYTWHPSAIHLILENEKYAGDLKLQKVFVVDHLTKEKVVNCGEIPQFLVEDCVPAIIGKKQWLATQGMRKRHQGVSKPPVKALPFRSLVFCGTCGKPCPQYSSHSEGRRLTAYHRCISWRDHTAAEVSGMTYVPPHKAGYNYNPTPELAAYRETYKKPKSRPFLCTDVKIRTERFPKAFMQAWNLIVSKKQRYLPSLQNTAATSDNPLTAYRAEEMIGLLETTGRLEEFDFSLMIRTLDRVDIMPTEKLSFIFQSGIRITV